ncbi:MAG: hypothetical protein JNL38_28820 [Myxococcales bacterium]|jgi:hypothetical protein|nr:hypothetical protein [Myxococcales bacterium]
MGRSSSALTAAVFIAALIAPVAPGIAFAGDPSAAERESARRLMDEGRDKTRSKDLEGALVAYGKAHGIMHVPTTGIALARTHLALGHLVEARDVALEVARFPKEKGEPAVFESARAEARDIEAATKDRIPTLRIKTKGGTAARVAIDGVAVSTALLDAPVAVNPGKRVVTVANREGAERKAEVDLAERDKKSVELEVPEDAKPSGPGPSSSPGPSASASPPPPSSGGGPGRAIFIGGAVITVVGAAAGTVTGLMTLSKADAVKPLCENGKCDPQAKSDLDGGKTLGLVSTVSFAVAGAGLVVAVVGLVWPSPKQTGFVVRPLVGPGAVGVGGAF